jgi:hypothetical protein
MSDRALAIATVLTLLCAAVGASSIVGGPGRTPHPNTGNMITEAAAQRAGASVLPTNPE